MSTATRFKHYRPFPFCAENMTASELAAQPFAKIGPFTLGGEGAMNYFWNLETVDMSYVDSNGIGSQSARPIISAVDAGSYTGSDSTPPRSRVCSPDPMGDTNYNSLSDAPQFAQTSSVVTNGTTEYSIVFRTRKIVYVTDTDKYWLIISIILRADGDGDNKAATTDIDDPECTVLSSSQAVFNSDFFDFYLRSDVIDTGTYAIVTPDLFWTY